MLAEGLDYERHGGLNAVPVGRSYVTLRNLSYTSEALGLSITVREGFEFDGPTGMPLLLRRWSWRFMRASLFHDGLYEPQGLVVVTGPEKLRRGVADALFMEIAKQDGAPRVHAFLAKTLIRWFGGRLFEDDHIYKGV